MSYKIPSDYSFLNGQPFVFKDMAWGMTWVLNYDKTDNKWTGKNVQNKLTANVIDLEYNGSGAGVASLSIAREEPLLYWLKIYFDLSEDPENLAKFLVDQKLIKYVYQWYDGRRFEMSDSSVSYGKTRQAEKNCHIFDQYFFRLDSKSILDYQHPGVGSKSQFIAVINIVNGTTDAIDCRSFVYKMTDRTGTVHGLTLGRNENSRYGEEILINMDHMPHLVLKGGGEVLTGGNFTVDRDLNVNDIGIYVNGQEVVLNKDYDALLARVEALEAALLR